MEHTGKLVRNIGLIETKVIDLDLDKALPDGLYELLTSQFQREYMETEPMELHIRYKVDIQPVPPDLIQHEGTHYDQSELDRAYVVIGWPQPEKKIDLPDDLGQELFDHYEERIYEQQVDDIEESLDRRLSKILGTT